MAQLNPADVLGLGHSDDVNDVMAPYYFADRIRLTDNDARAMEALREARLQPKTQTPAEARSATEPPSNTPLAATGASPSVRPSDAMLLADAAPMPGASAPGENDDQSWQQRRLLDKIKCLEKAVKKMDAKDGEKFMPPSDVCFPEWWDLSRFVDPTEMRALQAKDKRLGAIIARIEEENQPAYEREPSAMPQPG